MGADLETNREIQLQKVKDTYGANSKEYYKATNKGASEEGYNDWRIAQNQNTGTAVSAGATNSGNSTQAVRYRGSTDQTRVGTDTRVRGGTEASSTGQGMGNTDSGMAAALRSATGKQFADSSDVAPVASKSNAWQGNRTPVNLASVQQRVLKSIGQ
jgi:hypothetical protein